MIRDVTLGQYYKIDSVIHRLNPRTKLFWTFMFLIALFMTKNVYYFSALIVVLIVYIALSKVPVRYMLRGLKPVVILILFSMIMNLFERNGTVVFTFWKFHITDTGIRNAVFIGVRMVMMILGTSVMTYTTIPTDLTDGIEQSFHWMERFHVPVRDVAMMMSIALRFIPVLVEELDRIMKAQMSRGAVFHEGGIYQRVKALVPVIIPLFVSAVRRAQELALAMEARCYHGGEGRTRLHPLTRGLADVVVYIFGWLLFIAGVIIMFRAFY